MIDMQFIIETKLRKLTKYFNYEPDSEQEFETQKIMVDLVKEYKTLVEQEITEVQRGFENRGTPTQLDSAEKTGGIAACILIKEKI